MPLRSCLFLLLVIVSLLGCDPGTAVYAENHSGDAVRLRITAFGDTRVFVVPPEFSGEVNVTIGTSVEATIDLLDADCAVLKSIHASGQSVLVVVGPSDTLEARATTYSHPSNDPPVELRGECGSTLVKD